MQPLGHVIPQSMAIALTSENFWVGFPGAFRWWITRVGPRGDGHGEGSVLVREQQRRGEEEDVLPWEERVCKREQKLSTSSNIRAVQSQKK